MVVPTLAASLAWTSLGLQWMEMMAASNQVIARRMSRKPTASQWMHMGSEKGQAALASGSAMAGKMATLPFHDPMAMWTAWARLLSSGVAPYRSRAVRNAKRRRR